MWQPLTQWCGCQGCHTRIFSRFLPDAFWRTFYSIFFHCPLEVWQYMLEQPPYWFRDKWCFCDGCHMVGVNERNGEWMRKWTNFWRSSNQATNLRKMAPVHPFAVTLWKIKLFQFKTISYWSLFLPKAVARQLHYLE